MVSEITYNRMAEALQRCSTRSGFRSWARGARRPTGAYTLDFAKELRFNDETLKMGWMCNRGCWRPLSDVG